MASLSLRGFPKILIIGFLLFITVFALLQINFEKLIIYNSTPSVPEGFYRYAGLEFDPGRIVLFSTPQIVRDYTLDHYSSEPLQYFLKPVLAEQGDHVCYRSGEFLLNGEVFADVESQDRSGNPLPVWNECRNLREDEVFVYSGRVKNSFDSRYYGPVAKEQIIGAFVPLW